MDKRSPDWQQFEKIVAHIHEAATPGVVVRHNHRIAGRQFDVTISSKLGLHPLLIVIECKKYKRRITVDKVDAFATKLRDAGANKGIMISRMGFESGSQEKALKHGISLHTLQEATREDWANILGKDVPIHLAIATVDVQSTYYLSVAENQPIDVP